MNRRKINEIKHEIMSFFKEIMTFLSVALLLASICLGIFSVSIVIYDVLTSKQLEIMSPSFGRALAYWLSIRCIWFLGMAVFGLSLLKGRKRGLICAIMGIISIFGIFKFRYIPKIGFDDSDKTAIFFFVTYIVSAYIVSRQNKIIKLEEKLEQELKILEKSNSVTSWEQL